MPNNNNPKNNPVDEAKAATKAALAKGKTAADDVSDEDAAAADAVSNFLALANGNNSAETNPIAGERLTEVAKRIAESHNVLIALSSDPSVDELASAIGTSIYLDRMGKKATAIYSGSTPNALEFLNPGETFENSADVLQDFVIAINKDKADHLRYKLDGSYVKIYITPYKSKIEETDLEFSYGDYNVDLVLAFDVVNGIDLDEALREHGRIMHDAVIINITTGKPGKFGEIEWSEPKASSIAEIMASLAYAMSGKQGVEKEEATAFLTGIVAATNRFSNARTTAATMRMASRLMESGANQQLIAKNITADVDNELIFTAADMVKVDNDPTDLSVGHGENDEADDTEVVDADVQEKESTLLDDLKAAEAALAGAGAETVAKPGDVLPNAETEEQASEPMEEPEPVEETAEEGGETEVAEVVEESVEPGEAVEETVTEEPTNSEEAVAEEPAAVSNSGFLGQSSPVKSDEDEVIPGPQIPSPGSSMPRKEVVVTPPEDLDEVKLANPEPNKFEKMMAEALNEGMNPAAAMAPKVNLEPAVETVPQVDYGQVNGELVQPKVDAVKVDDGILPPPPAPEMPAAMMPEMPETNGAMPVLPPVEMPAPEMPAPENVALMSSATQPVVQNTPVAAETTNDPAAFKIPGLN